MLKILLKGYFLTLILLIPSIITKSQDVVFEQLSTVNGLSQNTIRCILQDREGFMWFGTLNGLNRYDGFKFISYKPYPGNLTDSRIKELSQDNHGFIWIKGFNNKYYCLDPVTNKFLNFLPDIISQNLTFNSLMQTKNGNICISTPSSGCLLLSYENQKWNAFTIKNRTNNTASISDDRINFTFEDSQNNIWIGTQTSLGFLSNEEIQNKTFAIKNFFNSTSQHIFILAEEDKHFIHFFTRKGVVIYTKSTKKFDYIESSSSTNIRSAIKYNATEYLLYTTNRGILVFNTLKKTIYPLPQTIDASTKLIAQIVHDKTGGFWITNQTGNIWRLDSITKTVKKFKLFSSTTRALIDDERILILTDARKNVWISTYGEGLYQYNSAHQSLNHFFYDPSSSSKLSSNYLLTLYYDRSGIIWIGTEHTGLNKISYVKTYFQTYFPGNDQLNPSSNFVRSLLEDKNNNLWISTKDGNIHVYDNQMQKSKVINAAFIKNLNIQGNVYCFLEDKKGWIWLGTKGNGVYAISPDLTKTTVKHFTRQIGNLNSLALDQIYGITEDYKGRLWFATFGGGISLLSNSVITNPLFLSFFTGTEGIKQVRCILSDSKNNIWMGTSNGVIVFHPDSLIQNPEKYTYYSNSIEDKTSLSSNEAKVIFEDKSGTIWIGTSNGLNKFISPSKKAKAYFEQYYIQNGLSNDIVHSLVEDKNGNLWIGTENGLSVFHPANKTFRNFRPSNNAMSNLISELAGIRRKSGELIFGSANGFLSINPENFKTDTTVFPVTLTNFMLSGVTVEPSASNSVLIKAISQTHDVVLPYTQNSFSIEFATLIYDNEHNYFSYILENYDKEWNPVINSNIASFKNLDPGKYLFKVKYLNPSGSNREKITELKITINPPFWRSTLAFMVYMALTIIILFSIKGIIDRIHKLQHIIEVEKQLTNYKIEFFTNVSHEFRTPLSLILGSLERINETIKLAPALQKHIQVMQRNTNRLLLLMDQLLDFAKVQNKSIKPALEQIEVIGLIKSIYNSFFDFAEKKEITYHFSSNMEKCIMYVDPNFIDKILYNLLSNAFKFTDDQGQIDLIVTTDITTHQLKIVVKDTGKGIPEDKQKLIFKRFAQIQPTTTGIGLSLTRELTELHNGQISFTSTVNSGSEFIVVLSTNPDLFDKEEIIKSTETLGVSQQPHFLQDEQEEYTEINEKDALNNNKILIVEDNTEIKEYLTDYLGKYFKVDNASDGAEGLQKAIDFEPDLIVCDIVMPAMNGIEVTKKLKGDFQTSHIPVMLLTAITSDEKKLEAIEAGADEYITKPFSIKYLLTKIFKLLEQRETLRKKFSIDASPINFTICKTEKDKLFLEKANKIAEQQMINPEFSVDDFAKQAGLGRTVFYKKLKGITGYTPNEFIRIIRMKKSLELLSTGDFTVSEVAHKVGMNDPFYFSRCFKSQFGQSPSIFIKGK